jgi:hypothetical protein
MGLLRSAALLITPLGFVLGILMPDAVRQPAPSSVARPTAIVAPAARAAIPGGGAQEWTVRVDDATVARHLNDWAAVHQEVETPFGPASFTNVTATIHPDGMALHGTAVAASARVPVNLFASASIADGRAVVQLRSAQINAVEMPLPVRRQVEQQLQNQVDQSLRATSTVARSLRFTEGALVLTGTRQ